MYNTTSSYYADLGIMRSEASVVVGGVRKTTNAGPRYRFTVRRFPDYGLAHLHFSMPDFYLLGVQIEAGAANHLYRFHGSTFAINLCTLHTQTFSEDYKAMGWNKSQDGLTITLNDVNSAFFEFFGNVPSKTSFRTIVVAFAEGFRFDRIARKVAEGKEIAGKELDWSADGATVVKGQ